MVELYMARTCRWGVVRVIGGDLHLQEADVVITPANNRLSGREGIDAQIHKAAGDELREFCRGVSVEQRKLNLPPCPVTTNVVSSPYNLKERFKHIIHVVSPDCRRPNQDESRRDLLPQTYHHLFDTLKGMKGVKVVMAPPLSMGVFAYPHREGARLTLETLLGIMDGDEDPGVKEYNIVVKERNFIKNMRTVYRESNDLLPGTDTTMV
jgi:O-acetyl-ADP-ribose deacetylase (regulator of RNase III)|tara:strand:- start:1625 stop:2251 length:627 start_codon:yes stop_codon:yes gene_type:complete